MDWVWLLCLEEGGRWIGALGYLESICWNWLVQEEYDAECSLPLVRIVCERCILPYPAQPVLPQDRFSASSLLVPSYSSHRSLTSHSPQYPRPTSHSSTHLLIPPPQTTNNNNPIPLHHLLKSILHLHPIAFIRRQFFSLEP